jgi:hypothetical protein
VPTLSIPTQHSLGIPSQSNKAEEEIKGIQIGKEELKLFADNMNLYIKDPKKLHQQTPRHHKPLQQCSRIQNQFTKISSLSIHQQ